MADDTGVPIATGDAPRAPPGAVPAEQRAAALSDRLDALRADIEAAGGAAEARCAKLPAPQRTSALNLIHYLELRRGDLRALQEELAALGLSSLGRSEAGVLGNLEAVQRALDRLVGRPPSVGSPCAPTTTPHEGHALLEQRTEQLFGPPRPGRGVRILVTLPSEAATDPTLVRELMVAGMDAARINCAHDDPAAWRAMAAHVRKASTELGRPCRILADLAGPKLRTGPVAPGPSVRRVRPKRDALGRVVAPGRVLFSADAGTDATRGEFVLVPAPERFVKRLAVGDRVRLSDARGADRTLTVTHTGPEGARAETSKTVYFATGLALRRRKRPPKRAEARVGHIPGAPGVLELHRGDTLELVRMPALGRPGRRDAAGVQRKPARIGCTLPDAFAAARKGHAIWFDDGKIGGVVRAASPDRLFVEIAHAHPAGAALCGDKGINLPDSALPGPALTTKDVEDLAFVIAHADAVSMSFARDPADVRALQERLAAAGASHLGMVLKIESRRGFERLPELLLAGLSSPQLGVMIARGDLAVECGFERLAEVQEEILWLAEAAHTPVVWATQVLEDMAKHGQPSRAEVTDAAMSGRAECVMLNKGPYIVETVRLLDGILRRMATHQRKKRPTFRPLRIAGRAFAPPEA